MESYKKFSDYDMFGYDISLYFNGNIKEGTLFGIISTILYIFIYIIITGYYLLEIISRKYISFSFSTINHEDAVSITLSKDLFGLNFALQDPITYRDYIDETIYSIEVIHATAKRDPISQEFSWIYEKLQAGPCSLDMFGKDNQHFFKDGYYNKYCIYDINNKNLTGHFVFDYYSEIVIKFFPCINTTENNNHCKSKEIIDYYLNNTYLGMFLQSYTIDENEIPMIRNYIENPFTTVGQNFFRDFQVLLKIIEIDDDTGIFL